MFSFIDSSCNFLIYSNQTTCTWQTDKCKSEKSEETNFSEETKDAKA